MHQSFISLPLDSLLKIAYERGALNQAELRRHNTQELEIIIKT